MMWRLFIALAVLGVTARPVPAAVAGAGLVETDIAMNRDIDQQGNDIHAMRAFMGEVDIAYSGRLHAFTNAHEVYKQAPTGPSPEIIQDQRTRYAVMSAADDLGISYGVAHTVVTGDKFLDTLGFYREFVFGLRAGLWTSKWAPTGAPRHYYFRYVRVWQRPDRGQPWRLVAGPFVARSDDLTVSSASASGPIQMVPLASPPPVNRDKALMQAHADIEVLFPEVLKQAGARAAYQRFAADDLLVVHEDQPPATSLKEFLDQLGGKDPKLELVPVGVYTSASSDLRGVYGFAYDGADQLHEHRMVYMQAWQYRGGAWKLILSYIRHTT